jgi:hypothetical protein
MYAVTALDRTAGSALLGEHGGGESQFHASGKSINEKSPALAGCGKKLLF